MVRAAIKRRAGLFGVGVDDLVAHGVERGGEERFVVNLRGDYVAEGSDQLDLLVVKLPPDNVFAISRLDSCDEVVNSRLGCLSVRVDVSDQIIAH